MAAGARRDAFAAALVQAATAADGGEDGSDRHIRLEAPARRPTARPRGVDGFEGLQRSGRHNHVIVDTAPLSRRRRRWGGSRTGSTWGENATRCDPSHLEPKWTS